MSGLGAAALSLACGCVPARPDAALNVVKVLNAQADAWNRGDIEAFMAYYWNSPELTFCAGGETLSGWSDTLSRYKARYPTPERMGRVTFDEIRLTPLCEDAVLAVGRWRVEREGGPIGGVFSLVLRRIDGRWLIVHDHTSEKKAATDGS